MKNNNNKIEICICRNPQDFDLAKKITLDYMVWLNMDLSFQDIDKEFKIFEKMYGYPNGCFLYAKLNDEVAGGVAFRKFEKGICEMKRLFVYNVYRGRGVGKVLCLNLVKIAKSYGYLKMRLDTIARLETANKLYENIGFYDIARYRQNPDKTARFMEIDLLNLNGKNDFVF
jgi:putative acetyltransferase